MATASFLRKRAPLTTDRRPNDEKSFSIPLRLAEWSDYRRPFRQGGTSVDIFHAVIPTDIQRDVLTPLLGTDPLADQLLVEAALGCAYSHWRHWRETARRWGAFEFVDLVGEVQALIVDSLEDFDPTRQSNFVVHAIGRVDVRLADQLHPLIHAAKTGSKIHPKALQRFRFEKATGERSAHLSDEMRDRIAEGDAPPKMVSLNSPVDREDADSADLIDILPSDLAEPDDIVEDRDARREAKERVAALGLSPTEFDLLDLYLGLHGQPPASLREIGKEIGANKNTVRSRLEKIAVRLGIDFDTLQMRHEEAKES